MCVYVCVCVCWVGGGGRGIDLPGQHLKETRGGTAEANGKGKVAQVLRLFSLRLPLLL